MRTLIKFFLDNYKLTMVITLFICLFGVNGALNLLREDSPSVDMGVTRITTIYQGATAEEVETEVTKKIEDKLIEVKGLKKVESRSQVNMSIIKITIDIDHFDVDEVNDDIKTEVEKVTGLPAGATKPDIFEVNTEEFAVIEMAIVGDNTGRKRDDYVDYLEDEIKEIKGVIKVDKFGYADREFSVKLDVDKMYKNDIGIDEVVNALKARNITVPAGSLKSYENQAFVRIDAKTKNVKDLENVLIRTNFEGKSIYLKDVAKVSDNMTDKEAYTKINGKEATILSIKKQGGIDTIKLAKKIKDRVEEVQQEMKSEFEVVYFVNAADDVENKFNIVVSNILSGVVIVLVFLLIFLPGKIGFVTTLSLPVGVLATLGIMYAEGMSLNNITMLGLIIALGMMVDNSVMISDNFAQFISEGKTIKDAAYEAAARFWVPVLTTTLTTICSFVPMFLTKGVMGRFISGIPAVVTIAILASLFESFFLLPCRLRMIGGSVVKREMEKKRNAKKSDWFDSLKGVFEKFVYLAVKFRYISLGVFVAVLMFSMFMLGLNQFILFPSENVEQYTVKYETNVGDSLEKMSDVTNTLIDDMERIIGKENIDNMVAYIGQSGTGLTEDLQQNHHTGELQIYINEEASYRLDYKKILAETRALPKPYLAKFEILQEAAGPNVGRAIEANFRSNNEEHLYAVVNHVFDGLSKTDGIIDLETNDYKNDDELFVKLDYDKIARLGLNVSSVGSDIQATIEGVNVANLIMGDDDFYIKVRFDDNFKQTEEDLRKITIRDPSGNLIPLTELATITRVAGSTMKSRYYYKKTITIRTNVDEKVITALEGNAILVKLYNEVAKDYPDVSLVFGGEQESAEESFSSLTIAMGYAVIAVFGFLVFIFNSYLSPIMIMTTIPLGLLGFSVAFYLHGRPLSFLAFIGVIGLIGVVVNTGIILISFIEILRKEDKKADLNTILATASGARLRAVLASASTTFVGLVPTAYGIGGRDASLIPVTMAMAWGLASSTVLSLVWIPCLYRIIYDFTTIMRKFRIAIRYFKRSRKSIKITRKMGFGNLRGKRFIK